MVNHNRKLPDEIGVRRLAKPRGRTPGSEIAAVYDRAGEDYVAYADGDPERLFSFAGPHAYADLQLWLLLEAKLKDLRATGATSLCILDAGCGPGTWLRRLVTRGRTLGFTSIAARGFDIAREQIQNARRLARELNGLPGVSLIFEVGNFLDPLPEADASIDLTLCLYSVLGHLPAAMLPKVAADVARVTRGYFVATVRSVGSTPTIFVDSMDNARDFKLDHHLDRCEIEFRNGRRVALGFHLFTPGELRQCFASHFEIEDLSGLDIFHNRFTPDPRWNPASLRVNGELLGRLARLEQIFCREPAFIERAAHLLLVGRRLPPVAPAWQIHPGCKLGSIAACPGQRRKTVAIQ